MKRRQSPQCEFVINKYLSVKLEAGKTVLYVGKQPFDECRHVFLNSLREKFAQIKSPRDTLDFDKNNIENHKIINGLTSEQEFGEYCSHLQVWAENGYKPYLFHRYLAFPLLEALYNAGDPIARIVFKEEIQEKFQSGYAPIQNYLINFGYIRYINASEWSELQRFITSMEVWDRIAQMYVRFKEYEKAICVYQYILDLDPNHHYTLIHLGDLFYWTQDYLKSLDHYFRATEVYEHVWDEVYFSIGKIFRKLGHHEDAKRYFRFVASHRDSCERSIALFELADMFIHEGQIYRAKRYLWRILSDDISDDLVWDKFISIFRKEGNSKRVIAVLKEAFKYNPIDFEYLEQLAELYKKQHKRWRHISAKLKVKIKKRRVKGIRYMEAEDLEDGRIKITASNDGDVYYHLSVIDPASTRNLLLS